MIGCSIYKLYYEEAERGDAFSQYRIGWCYKNGEGVQKDMTKAVEWYHKAVENADNGQGDETLRKQLQELKNISVSVNETGSL